jgi:hypothetical protein
VAEHIEIEDPREITRLNDVLSARLKDTLLPAETRTIGDPSGRFTADVRFLSRTGIDVFYWWGGLSRDETIIVNLFGHGAPDDREDLVIDVYFNFRRAEFRRTLGGAFLLHTPTGRVVLAHRGLVTRGHGRVPKAALFSEMTARVLKAHTGNGTSDFLVIGELESPTLINDIDAFSPELRRAAIAIKG